MSLQKQLNKITQIGFMHILAIKNKLKMKNTTTMTATRISKTKAVELINNSKGRRFTVTFTKKNGTLRTMNGSRKNQTSLGNITMTVTNRGYRTVNPNTITELKINRNTYIVK